MSGRQPQWKTTIMEDDLNGRYLNAWKIASMEDELKLKKLQWKTPQWKMTSMEEDLNRGLPQYILEFPLMVVCFVASVLV